MNIHISYQAWTYDAVRARIIEAAETLIMSPADLGPRLVGMGIFEEYQDDYRRGETTRIRRIPTARALAEMEETWTWINQWLDEKDRKLVYDYGFIMSRKGLTLGRWCEKNGWVERTFQRAVKRCCQRIADNLNRNHAIRLTTAVDGVSANQAEQPAFEVGSDNRAPVQRELYYRAEGATPIHIPGSEAEIARHIETVNRQRREEAERQRKAELRRKEDAARLAAQVAARQARKEQAKQKAA